MHPSIPWSLRSSWVGANFSEFVLQIWPTKCSTRSVLWYCTDQRSRTWFSRLRSLASSSWTAHSWLSRSMDTNTQHRPPLRVSLWLSLRLIWSSCSFNLERVTSCGSWTDGVIFPHFGELQLALCSDQWHSFPCFFYLVWFTDYENKDTY